jgi:DNA-binding NarL/FixJ family response regulator
VKEIVMVKSSVFIIWNNPLFHEAIRLLLRHPNIKIIGATTDHDDAQTQIAKLHPDIVILETSSGGEELNGETFSILRTGPKVVCLGLADNALRLYQRREKIIDHPDELLNFIFQGQPDHHNKK